MGSSEPADAATENCNFHLFVPALAFLLRPWLQIPSPSFPTVLQANAVSWIPSHPPTSATCLHPMMMMTTTTMTTTMTTMRRTRRTRRKRETAQMLSWLTVAKTPQTRTMTTTSTTTRPSSRPSASVSRTRLASTSQRRRTRSSSPATLPGTAWTRSTPSSDVPSPSSSTRVTGPKPPPYTRTTATLW